MLFSILIPVYNTSEYLDECMESILTQSFTDFEVVLLNDGSTDISPEICDKYAQKDTRVRVIHKENEGLMMTRRRGFKEAKGDYFICVDSDDKLYEKKALEKIHNVIINSKCDLVIYNYVYGAGGQRTEKAREIFEHPNGFVFDSEKKNEVYEKLLTTNYMNNIWIKCPSRNIVDIDTDYSIWKNDICRAEDLFQNYPMLDNAKRIGYISDPLYYYRWTPDSISNKTKPKYYDAFKCIFKRENEYLDKWNISGEIEEKAKRRRLTIYMSVVCKSYFKCKENKDVKSWENFIKRLSDDVFFLESINECNKEKVLKYYRMLYSLISKKRVVLTKLIINITSFISEIKHKK